MPIIPQVAATLSWQRSEFEAPLKHAHTYFNLDASGLAGFFGGQAAVSAMPTVHLYEYRKWLGWYNSPGSYELAKRYGGLTRSRFFKGVRIDPATLLQLDGIKGPQFRAVHSRTTIDETGFFAALFMKACASLPQENLPGRITKPVSVTIANLRTPHWSSIPVQFSTRATVYASLPISVSVGTCVTSAVSRDWCAFALILLGILVNGFSCLVIGSGDLIITYPQGEVGPPGDGILTSSNDIVVLQGDWSAVNAIIRGTFSLQFKSEPLSKKIRWCTIFLIAQFLAQLFFIPQATLFGQIMFVASLSASWTYNMWLSSFDKEAVWTRIMEGHMVRYPKLTKYKFGTRTSMAVFTLLILKPGLEQAMEILNTLLPNDTKVWCIFKNAVIRGIRSENGLEISVPKWELLQLAPEEKELLHVLFCDTQDGYRAFQRYHDKEVTHNAQEF